MVIRSGSLNRPLRFQRRAVGSNEFNEDIGSWVDLAEARGEVRALNAREFFAALQTQSESTLLITCRYMPALANARPADRVLDGSRIYDIRAVQDPDGRRRELRFYVVEHGPSH